MKTLYSIAAALLLTVAGAAYAEQFDLHRLSWLEGHWTGTKDGVEMEERWTSTKGGALLGVHRDVKNGRMVSFEFMRIDSTNDGAFYFASPMARPATAFKLITLKDSPSDKQVVFENKEHDFPQRVLYWLDTRGALHARIEGPMNGKEVSEEWVWTKALPRKSPGNF